MKLNKAIKKLKKYHMKESAEELGISVEEYKKKDMPLPYKYNILKEGYKKIDFIPAKRRKDVKEAFKIVKKHIPSLDLNSIYILSEKYYLRHSGSFIPVVMDNIKKYSIVLTGSHIRYMSPKVISGILFHESIHLDMAEYPERYGFGKPEAFFIGKFFHLDEDKIWKKTRKIFGTKWEKEKDEAKNKAFKDKKERKLKRLWNWRPYFRLLTLTKGESYNPVTYD